MEITFVGKNNREKYDLLFFYPKQDKYTLIKFPSGEILYGTYGKFEWKENAKIKNHKYIINGIEFYIEKISAGPLCVNLYFYDNDLRRLYGTATCFDDKTYHIIDYAVAEMSKRYEYISHGTIQANIKNVKKPDFYQLQKEYYKQIDAINIGEHVFTNHDCDHIKYSTYHFRTRILSNVFVQTPLKHFRIPPPVFEKGLNYTQVLQKAYAKLNKYTPDYHIEEGKSIKTDAWSLMFVPECGNCKDMALTMYVILRSHFPGRKFALCSTIISAGNVPHCICVDISERDHIIIDATLTPEHQSQSDLKKKYSHYTHMVTLFTEEKTYFLQKDNSVGVTVRDFIKGDYERIDKFKDDDESEIAYMYEM
jgi:hypothetical protein